ncbi:YitT family protein, partial [Aminipila sp.]
MKKITEERVKNLVVDFILILIACCLGAFATVSIMLPNGLSSGGLTGVIRILHNYLPLDFSAMYYIGALIILAICAIVLGLKEAKKIVLMSIMYPTVMVVFEQMNFQLLEEKDMFLAAIYCGIFSGICSGIAFSRGYSSGGSDTVAKIIQKKLFPHVSLSKLLMAIDAGVIVTSGFVFGRNIALYALV